MNGRSPIIRQVARGSLETGTFSFSYERSCGVTRADGALGGNIGRILGSDESTEVPTQRAEVPLFFGQVVKESDISSADQSIRLPAQSSFRKLGCRHDLRTVVVSALPIFSANHHFPFESNFLAQRGQSFVIPRRYPRLGFYFKCDLIAHHEINFETESGCRETRGLSNLANLGNF
jgi:hypothetical protein